MVSDMEVWMKQRCGIEFLHAEKMAPIDIHQHLLNFSEEQTVDVSTVRWWMVRFSSCDSDSDLLHCCRFLCSMQALVHGWLKCIASGSDCAEK